MIALVKLSVHCFGFVVLVPPRVVGATLFKVFHWLHQGVLWCPFLNIGSIITVHFGAVVRLSAVLSQDNTGGAEQLTQLSIKF